ncbi:MAG: DUF4430 domain-containing protein [Collinsella sp.]
MPPAFHTMPPPSPGACSSSRLRLPAEWSWAPRQITPRSWGFYVNGESASEGVSSYKVKPGDSLSLIYLYNFKEPATEVDGRCRRPEC